MIAGGDLNSCNISPWVFQVRNPSITGMVWPRNQVEPLLNGWLRFTFQISIWFCSIKQISEVFNGTLEARNETPRPANWGGCFLCCCSGPDQYSVLRVFIPKLYNSNRCGAVRQTWSDSRLLNGSHPSITMATYTQLDRNLIFFEKKIWSGIPHLIEHCSFGVRDIAIRVASADLFAHGCRHISRKRHILPLKSIPLRLQLSIYVARISEGRLHPLVWVVELDVTEFSSTRSTIIWGSSHEILQNVVDDFRYICACSYRIIGRSFAYWPVFSLQSLFNAYTSDFLQKQVT